MEDINAKKSRDDLWELRHINRYVWYQIRQMINNDLQLGRIIKIDEDGVLRVNMNSKLIDEEQKHRLFELIAKERDGIYRNNQLEDLDHGLDSKEEYDKWFDDKAMDSFMYTVPTRDVFYTRPVNLFYKLRENHSHDEIGRQNYYGFGGYSIWQTIYALDIIDPFLVGLVLGGDIKLVELKDRFYIEHVKFNYNGRTLYATAKSIELYERNKEGKLVKLEDTIHTLLLRHYREPIFTTLNSMMYPIGGERVLPHEGCGYDKINPELTNLTEDILSSDFYGDLARRRRLCRSRVNPANPIYRSF